MIPVAIIDTTTTARDVLLENSAWEKVLALSKRDQLRLVVPEVVLLETARHWEREVIERSELPKAVKRIQERLERLKRLGMDIDYALPPPPEIERIDRAAFTEKLRLRLVSAGAHIAPVPEISVKDVLQRDLDGRRPFQESGKGFRDTLIWETVREVINALDGSAPVYFVSDNVADYWGADGLHQDLNADLSRDSAEVKVVRSLPDLLREEPLIAAVASLQVEAPEERLQAYISSPEDSVEDGLYPSVTEFVTKAVISALENLSGEEIETHNAASWGISFTDIGVSAYLENPRIAGARALRDVVDWHAYETFDETTLLIQASIDVEVEIEGSVHRSDYVEAEQDGVSISGFDPDEYYCDGWVSVEARAVYQLRVESGAGVEDIELEGFEST